LSASNLSIVEIVFVESTAIEADIRNTPGMPIEISASRLGSADFPVGTSKTEAII
jgi:hypothetical protein